jgi:hypothetical protein
MLFPVDSETSTISLGLNWISSAFFCAIAFRFNEHFSLRTVASLSPDAYLVRLRIAQGDHRPSRWPAIP